MQEFEATPPNPDQSIQGPVESAPLDTSSDFDPAAHGGGDENVEMPIDDIAGTRSTSVDNRRGFQSKWLRRATERNMVRGFTTKKEVIRLHCMEGKPLKEIARLLGRNHRYIQQVWQSIVADVKGRATKGEHDDDVRTFADKHLRNAIQEASGLISDSAAYGAVVIRGVAELCALHGVKPEEGVTGGIASLESIGMSVRVASPMLLDKLDRLQRIKDGAGALTESPSRVESEPVEVV